MPDDITLHTSCSQQVTCISNSFIDHYMAEADGEYVKIYLYLLRALTRTGGSFSMHEMADTLDHTERDLRKALTYWEEKKLLRMEYDSDGNPVGICILDPTSEPKNISIHVTGALPSYQEAPVKAQEIPVVQETPEEAPSIPTKPSFTREERSRLTKEDNTKELLYVTEQFLGKPLNRTEADTILFWHWTLGLSVDLIEYLVEQCVDNGHTSIHYMNAIALRWKELGITTEEEAKLQKSIHSQAYYTVLRSLGISGRSLTPNEEEFLRHWTVDFGFANEIIGEACERAVRGTGKPSFEYTDKILTSWFQNEVKSVKDIEALDKNHSSKTTSKKSNGRSNNATNGFRNFDERNYKENDYLSIEEKLLNNK